MSSSSTANSSYDVIIIGAGPGGYVCALRCAQLGFKTAVIDKGSTLGGTCLNVGCIPSKALLHASERFEEAESKLESFGIDIGVPKLNLKNMMGHKEKVVSDNTAGIEFLFKKNKIDWLQGEASIVESNVIRVKKGKKTQKYEADSIIIATGSEVVPLPNVKIDEKIIISSTGALELGKVPKTLAVIGGGVIGLELGTVWRRLGAKVTVIEYMDVLMPDMDKEISKQAQKILTKQGIEFKLSSKVTDIKKGKNGAVLSVEPASGGSTKKIKADIVLVAIGRRPCTSGLGLDKIGVDMDERGRIKTDDTFETSVEGIYAIGDVIAGPMLAHKASDEGVILAEMLAGQSGHIDYNLIPSVVYTHPEIASIGRTEEQLKEADISYKVGKFPFSANARARAMGCTDGFVKILADKKTDLILGCHIIGPEAGTLIAEITAFMEFSASSEDVARTCHPHPTLEEVIKEAALAVDGFALHI